MRKDSLEVRQVTSVTGQHSEMQILTDSPSDARQHGEMQASTDM